MTKIEFLKKLFLTDDIHRVSCGQIYEMRLMGTHLLFVDDLKGGRVSIKLKYFTNFEQARVFASMMWHSLQSMSVDWANEATVDIYKCEADRYSAGWAARLRCRKHW